MKTCATCKRSWEDEFRVCPIDGSPLQAAAAGADVNIGKTIGTCRLVEKVAQGDLGAIYKAEDPIRGAIAIQLVAPERVSSAILLEALGEAVKLAARLHHPNVIRVFGIETAADGTAAVLMEYVPGTDLQSYRRARPGMDTNEACGIIRQACEGIVAAHRMSMLHGALHPARIMVAPDGTIKLGGFHRSALREGVDVFTATASNLPYLAPEQLGIVRNISGPDYRTDVYALGVILYELLAARLPYEAGTVQDLARSIEGSPPLPPNFSNPSVSPLLSRVVMKAVAKQPTERQGSVEEFLRELDAARQTARDARPPVSSPLYPPPSADSGAFAPPARSPADSSLFAPARRRESTESIWPEAADEKAGAGEGSFFGWFKTRSGSSAAKRSQTRGGRGSWDDTSSTDVRPRRSGDDEFTERTVIASGDKNRNRRRSFSDTFTGFGRRRDQDMTGTGPLPGRKVPMKVWIIAASAFAGVVALGILLYVLFFSTPRGKLIVLTTPPGAQILVCEEPCEKGFRPLSGPELPAGIYRVRVQMEGYEAKEERLEIVENADTQRYYELVSKLPPMPVPVTAPEAPPEPVQIPAQPQPSAAPKPSLTTPFYSALRQQSFFPDSPNNAWDILQRWNQSEAGTPTPALEEALQRFCRAVEDAGQDKLYHKDFAGARQLLDQLRSRTAGQPCAAGLQAAYEKAVSNDKANLLISAQGAMDRQSFVTPEAENALKYIRHIQNIDPQDADARRLEGEIFGRAWEQARAVAVKRQHQQALDIYNQLRIKYPNPPVGMPAILEAIQKQTQKLEQYQALKTPYSVQVKHGHGRGIAFWKTRECSGTLTIDGLSLDYKSTDEKEHSFNISYDGLKGVKLSGNTLTITHPAIRPDGRIELDEADKQANPNLAAVYKKILEYREKYAEYIRP